MRIAPDLDGMTKLCRLANRVGREINGRPDMCVLMSAALLDVLAKLGIPAEPLRVTAGVHCSKSRHRREWHGVVLGSDGAGERLPKASVGAWYGHLVVIVLGRYLLDATLDQANKHPWLRAEPFAAEINPEEFLSGKKSLFTTTGKYGSTVCYSVFHHQKGFRNAPDFRFRSHRRDIVLEILRSSEMPEKPNIVESIRSLLIDRYKCEILHIELVNRTKIY